MTGQNNYFTIKWDYNLHGCGECEVHVLSYEQGYDEWVGSKVYGAWMDEPPPYMHYQELVARLGDAGGWLLQSFTPVDGIGWWYPAIWKPAKEQRPGFEHWFHFQAALAERDPENVDEHEVGRVLVPHFRLPFHGESVDPDGNPLVCTCPSIELHGSCRGCRDKTIRMASNYADVADREIRIFGVVRGRQGLVYKDYDERVHVVPHFPITPEYDIIGGVDPGSAGFHMTLGAISPDDRVYICEELYSQRQSTQDRFDLLVKRVQNLLDPKYWRGRTVEIVFFVDTADPEQVLDLNIEAAKYSERTPVVNGIRIVFVFAALEQGLKARLAGFQRVGQMLQPRKHRHTPAVLTQDPNDPNDRMRNRPRPDEGEPLIYFFDNLYCEWQGVDRMYRESRIKWEIMLYSWMDPHRDTTTQRDDANEHSADGAHAMASLRYMIMSRYGLPYEEEDEEIVEGSWNQVASHNFHQALRKKMQQDQETEQSDWMGGGEW